MKKDKQNEHKVSLEDRKKKRDNAQDTQEVFQRKKLKIKMKDTCQENIEKSIRKEVHFAADVEDNEVETSIHTKKRKVKRNLKNLTDDASESKLPTAAELIECEKPENKKNVTSKRQQKREKFEKLKSENKLKSEAHVQQKALNYLSLWKHNRNEWKFEKLRQVWVQNHMFDKVSVPDEFWVTVMEYFGGAKGKIRQVLTEDCMKILEETENKQEENNDTKYQRARTLLQNLQE